MKHFVACGKKKKGRNYVPTISSVPFRHSVVFNSVTPFTAALQASLSITTSGLVQIHVHQVSVAIQPSHPLPSPPPSFNVAQHQGFFNESVLPIRWSKYWSFSFSISPSNEYSGLISFGMDWLDLLAVQEVIGQTCSLGKTLLAFALFHSVLQGQICLLLQVFLDFLLLLSSPL